jgi:hypothetical protein
MCRNIRTLYNFEPPASETEIREAALQFVRKISGFPKPSAANQDVFNRAVDDIANSCATLLGSLVTAAPPKNRQAQTEKSATRAIRTHDILRRRRGK